jgi:protein ImuB
LASYCRIGCVRIGRFAIGAHTDGAQRRAEPVALFVEERGKPRVAATDAEAARRGLVVGMAVPQAKALASDLVTLPWNDEKLARAALTVTTALLAASPRVAWARNPLAAARLPTDCASAPLTTDSGVWWIDAAGLGEEKRLAQLLLRITRGLGYGEPRVGIADSAIAAHAATFRPPAAPPSQRRAARIVPSGGDAAFLASYPLALLDLDENLADTFHALGLGTVGQLAALEEGEIEARFGPAGLAAHRLALGLDTRGPSTPRDDTLPAVELDLGGAVAAAEPLLFVLKGALGTLGEALRAKGLAARELTIALTLDDGTRAERAVRPARPTSHADALFDHCRAALEDWRLPEPVVALALRAAVTVPAAGEQGDLLAPRWADPAALEAAFDRIRGREGGDAVTVPEMRDGHLPQDEGAWRSAAGEGGSQRPPRRALSGRSPAGAAARPSARPPAAALRRLEQPTPIRVRLGRSGLEAFRHDDVWHDVAAWSGPERLTPRWWASDAGARDYYTTRTTGGTCWLLFRSAKERTWFVEGWWD